MITNSDMPKMKDRMRLKDRILERIGKAIRIIQDCQSRSGDESVVLTNSDWQLHKLVEHLDHAFLHGLRHITNGYWILVQDFTNKSTVKDINQLCNVTTNLGRGRAWLYQAINDQLLESYAKCYLDNPKLVKKFYVKEALVLDDQRLQILVTLVSGLEMTFFQLEIDVPYLDLASYMKPKSSESEGPEERISLSSLDSFVSQGSSVAQDPFDENNTMLPSRGQRSLSMDQSNIEKKPIHSSFSLPILQPDHMTVQSDDITIPHDHTVNTDYVTSGADDSETIEVIHLTFKGHKGRKKKTAQRKSENDVDAVALTPGTYTPDGDDRSIVSGVSTATITPTTPESGYRSVIESQSILQQDSEFEGESVLEDCLHVLKLNNNVEDSPFPDVVEGCNDKGCSNEINNVVISKDSVDFESLKPVTPISVQLVTNLNWTAKELQLVQSLETDGLLSGMVNSTVSMLDSKSVCTDLATNVLNSSSCGTSSLDELNVGTLNCDSNCEALHRMSRSPSQTTDGGMDSNCDSPEVQERHVEQSIYDDDCNVMKPCSDSAVLDTISPDTPAIKTSQMNISDETPSPSKGHKIKKNICSKRTKGDGRSISQKDHDAEVIVDNNLMLLLMLEVFEVEDEKLLKMYQTCLGHTEGAVLPVYVLLTDAAVYLLTTKYGQKKFKKEGVVKHRELDYISLSLNYQVINMICTNRRKQFWLTTGDEQLTRCLVSHLDLALRTSKTALSPLSVLTDATTQKIAINKWLATECVIKEPSEIQILQYNLVNWEDLSSDETASLVPATNKDGILYYKVEAGLFFASYWKEAYFVLKDGFFYQYSDRHDNLPPKLCIQLNQEDCVGCRHCNHVDRQHCFEIILSSGNTVQLSARGEKESREWLQSLCQAVSQGVGMSAVCTGLSPCCSVVTNTHLVLFHEDVQTNFCRTLAAVQLTDLVSVMLDPGAQIYVVMVFESHVEKSYNQKWVVYFNTALEREGFLAVLCCAWTSHFQVKLPKSSIKDLNLRTRCRAGIGRLKKQRRV